MGTSVVNNDWFNLNLGCIVIIKCNFLLPKQISKKGKLKTNCNVQTGTPLWRNGPPDKPVLCNACGSRWRTKGTLVNYTPTRSREFEEVEVKPRPKLPIKIKNVSFKYVEDKKTLPKEELSSHGSTRMVLEGDISSRSCSGSGSAISSESCVVTRTNDLTGES